MPIDGTNHPSYVVAADTGSFYVLITDSCGCSYTSDTANLQGTGITQIHAAGLAVTVYPNPGTGAFDLAGMADYTMHALNYVVTDLSGKVLMASAIPVTSNTFTCQLNLSSLADGIYFLRLHDSNGSRVVKLVKGK